jgi:hypothetical protein
MNRESHQVLVHNTANTHDYIYAFMSVMRKHVYVSMLIHILCVCTSFSTETSTEFPAEFLAAYDITKRDTHEYNPYILKKTRKSFLELEQQLESAGFSLAQRFCIFGYQEEAVPPYTTNWQRVAIQDEIIAKTHAGISAPTKNIFGFMTGFLLKDVQWLQKEWFKSPTTHVMHICARPIALFADSALAFQKHAFGAQFNYLIQARDAIERHAYRNDLKAILSELISFWSHLEKEAAKNGAQETVASQDMLFSIDYARALVEGKTPVEKICVGPDITYPIEVLSCQKTHATLHAQEFVQKLQTMLEPVNQSNTAYIFCSFVDGVGKSTLLNNIQNWHAFGNQFEKYKRCDNSSSQEAQLFKFKERVYIVDLPAQMSHFVIKPDGSVFADIETVKEITPAIHHEIQVYVQKKQADLIAHFNELKKIYATGDKPLYESSDALAHYAQNCAVLAADTDWIPFKYRDFILLVQMSTGKLRVLVPFGQAHSLGLKVIEPEQMLFNKGIALPMQYNVFMSDLIAKLKKEQIKQICFVDFLSMYPRSSRETIRLNFVLQYVKKIFASTYNIDHTVYKQRVYKEQELCDLLVRNFDKAIKSLVLESSVRWALDCLLEQVPSNKVGYIAGQALEMRLNDLAQRLYVTNQSYLTKLATDRLDPVRTDFEKLYSFDNIYEAVVKFSAKPLAAYSRALKNIFMQQCNTNYLRELWSVFPDALPAKIGTIRQYPHKITHEAQDLSIVFKMHRSCKEEERLKNFIRPLRAQWYAMLTHLLYTTFINNELQLTNIKQVVPSLMLYEHADGFLYGVQKTLRAINIHDSAYKNILSCALFNINDAQLSKRLFGEWRGIPHCLDWSTQNTYSNIYGYGYNDQNTGILSRLVNLYHDFFMRAGKPRFSIYATQLLQDLSISKCAAMRKTELLRKNISVLEPTDLRIPGIRLWVRAIATLDMILKDTEAKVLVRKGNKEDFSAAVQLLEQYTLPDCFGILCKSPLFADYTTVEPLISWDIINTYE